jgi:gliding motility-associated-like protein
MLKKWFKYLLGILCLLMAGNLSAQLEFNMSDTVVTECKGILYDNGGDGVNYLHNTNQTFTICLDAPGITTLSFDYFCVEVGFDSLTFHAGPDETYPQIGPAYSGTTNPPAISISQGCLSLHFVTDANVACTGWEASWTTQVIPPVPPQIDAVLPAPSCSTTTATVNLSKKLHCDSVYVGAFELLGPTILEGLMDQSILSAVPVNCIGDSTQQVALTFAPGLNQGGTYQLELTTNYYDACDSLWTFTTVDSFRVDDCPIVVNLFPDRDSICVGECTEIEAVVTGGNGVYSYTWSNGLPSNAGPQNVCPVATTTYTLTVDDTSPAVPASGSTTITVFTPAVMPPSSSQCQSAPPVDLDATPNTGWWFGPGITDTLVGIFNGDSAFAGINQVGYYLPITETFGCSSYVAINILPIDAGLPVAACPGSPPFQLNGFAPIGGTWSGSGISSSGVFDPNSIGVFTVTYSVNGCTEDLQINVDNISIVPTSVDSICQSGASISYTLQPPGGRWSGPGIVDTLLGTFDPGEAEGGFHTITYSLFGCSQDLDVFVREIFAGWNSNACPAEGTVQLDDFYPSGGIWSGDGIVDPANGLLDATFNGGDNFQSEVIYTLANGCTDTATVYVEYTRIEQDTFVFCKGDNELELVRDVMGNYPWGGSWSGLGVVEGEDDDPDYFYTNISGNGLHQVVYTNNTCADTAWFFVQQSMLEPAETICESAPEIQIVVESTALPGIFSGDGIVNDSLGLFSPSDAGDGEIEIVYTSGFGCSDTINVEVEPFIQADLDTPGGSICYVDTLLEIEVSPAGGILTGIGLVDTLFFNPFLADEGEHLLIYEVGEGYCRSVDSAIVTVAPRIGYEVAVNDDSLCYGDYTSVNVSAWGGNGHFISYIWSDDLPPLQQQILSPPISKDYTLTITDGCSRIRDTISIYVAEKIDFTIETEVRLCYGEPSFAVVSPVSAPAYGVNWRGIDYQSGESLPGSASNTYSLEVTDPASGCTLDSSVTLPGFPLVKAQFSVNPDLECIPAEIRDINFIDLSTGASQGLWSFGDAQELNYEAGSNPTHEYILHGGYEVTLEVADSNGCSDVYSRTICLEEPYNLFVPSGFTVNGDGLNEVFLPRGNGVKTYKLWVYDGRGKVIFESDDIDKGWDGTFEGRLVQSDVYAWIIEVQWTNNNWFSKTGSITLMR